MTSGKGHHQDEEDEVDEEFSNKKDATTSANTSKDGKNSDKANAIRSKHSVTEQRRRSKINERFQILRELIPNGDQKRDTASFLLEVIQYVQILQGKVQKYEGSYQPWSSEPTKLMPWRNSHWRVQSSVGQPQTIKHGTDPGSMLAGRFDENGVSGSTMVQPVPQNSIESDHVRDSHGRPMDSQTERGPAPDECADTMNRQDELTVEGGTISITSAYSQGLLNSLPQALQSTGLDLSQASISVQINLGKRASRGPTPGSTIAKDVNNSDDTDQAQKRQKI